MSELTQVLRHMVPFDDPNALVDASTGDDAAVYRIAEDRALVATADFFTPIVDDPFDYGRIAAANALSDLYAMGARPLFALNLVGFPRDLLDAGILEEILRGGSTVTASVGIPVLGGHSIDDREPKYGLVAIGEVHPDRMVTNAGARPGDVLVLTKALGTGIVATAAKAEAAPAAVLQAAVESMAALNHTAAEAMSAAEVRGATDVTGFGLLGHLRNMLRASGCAGVLRARDVALLPGVVDLVAAGHVPGGTRRNLSDVASDVVFRDDLSEEHRIVLSDAQTSGGLLMCVEPSRLDTALAHLAASGTPHAVIGEVVPGDPGQIEVA
jgi:selenide,water dikinase